VTSIEDLHTSKMLKKRSVYIKINIKREGERERGREGRTDLP